jgi:hypothetical protein
MMIFDDENLLAYFGSNVSIMGGFCLDHRHLRKIAIFIVSIYRAHKQRTDKLTPNSE